MARIGTTYRAGPRMDAAPRPTGLPVPAVPEPGPTDGRLRRATIGGFRLGPP